MPQGKTLRNDPESPLTLKMLRKKKLGPKDNKGVSSKPSGNLKTFILDFLQGSPL
jgi:hypothetical protein